METFTLFRKGGKIMEKKQIEEMIDLAIRQMDYSYAPYSHFHVGSAVLSEDNYVYTGCNIENSSYGATNCAERTAIFKCVSDQKTRIKKIAIASDSREFTWPCGICRQVMSEFMDSDGIIILENHGLIKKFKLDELLPHSFGACDIKTE